MHIKSDSITELAKALAQFHSCVPQILKNATNPHFRNNYADLGGILDAVRQPLAKAGLSVLQLLGDSSITTMLLHTSGEFIQTTAPLIIGKNDMQGFGSAVSYQRRYSLTSILSLSALDDDGQAASRPSTSQKFEEIKASTKKAPAVDYLSELTTKMNVCMVREPDLFQFLASKDIDLNGQSLKDLPRGVVKGLVVKWDEVISFLNNSHKEAA